jgi:hypothetical protein
LSSLHILVIDPLIRREAFKVFFPIL